MDIDKIFEDWDEDENNVDIKTYEFSREDLVSWFFPDQLNDINYLMRNICIMKSLSRNKYLLYP